MKKYTKKILCLVLSVALSLCFSIAALAVAPETKVIVGEVKGVIVPVDSKTDMVVNLTVKQSRIGEYAYANAHGWFNYAGTNKRISSYGMDVSFKINSGNNTSAVENGGYINTYHNAYEDRFKGISKSKIRGEDTSNCAAQGIFTVVDNGTHGDPAYITLTLEIKSDGSKLMHVKGSYDQWDVEWE